MAFRFLILNLFAGLVLFSSCTKETEKLVPGNEIATDSTITLLQQEAYLNRLYISLLGRKPDSTEQKKVLKSFEADGCGLLSRVNLVDDLLADDDFSENLYRSLRREYLDDLDTATIAWQIKQWNTDLERLERENPNFAEILRLYIIKLQDLEKIPNDLRRNRINLVEAHRRAVDNIFYDEINMGTENFVVSCFSHFLNRFPTFSELDLAKKMVDAQPGILFGEYGRSKIEYLDIFFASNGYFEGQIRLLYLRYLLREPTADEWVQLKTSYIQEKDYKKLYRQILTSTEFVRGR